MSVVKSSGLHRITQSAPFACASDHDLVELFAKRSFQCDCGTLSICRGDENKEMSVLPCNLRGNDLKFAPQNDSNIYSKNFDGAFCRCERGKKYDPETEEEVRRMMGEVYSSTACLP